MNMQFKDFLIRYAVLIVIGAGIMIPFAFMGADSVIVSQGLMLLGVATVLIDQSTGVARVKTMLPLKNKERARVTWIQGILVFPGLYTCILVPCLICTFLFGNTDSHTLLFQLSAPIIGMGFAAGAYLLLPGLFPTPGCFWEQIRSFLLSMGYLVVFVGVYIWLLPRTTERISALLLRQKVEADMPPLPELVGVLLFVSILIVLISFLFSRKVYENMPLRAKSPAATEPGSASLVFPSRCRGFLAPWRYVTVMAVGITGAFLILVTVLERLCCSLIGLPEGDKYLTFAFALFMLFVPCLLLLSLCGMWTGCMRGLRMLPMSRVRLTILLLSFFLLCMTIAGTGYLFLAYTLSYEHPAREALWYGLNFFAWGSLCLWLLVRFGGPGTFVLMIILWGAPVYSWIWTSSVHDGNLRAETIRSDDVLTWIWSSSTHYDNRIMITNLIVAAITIISVLLIYYAIGNSSAVYRRKPFMENGPFGQP